MLHGSKFTVMCTGELLKVVGDVRYLVAMAHPCLAHRCHVLEQRIGLVDVPFRSAVFSSRKTLDLSSQYMAGKLHSVADAQDRDAQLEQLRIALWGTLGVHARGTPGKNQPERGNLTHTLGGNVVSHDFAVNMLFAHPTGDQLGKLRTKIQHQHPLGKGTPLNLRVLIHHASRAVPAPGPSSLRKLAIIRLPSRNATLCPAMLQRCA